MALQTKAAVSDSVITASMFLGLIRHYNLYLVFLVTALNIFFFGSYPLCLKSTDYIYACTRNEPLKISRSQSVCVACIHYYSDRHLAKDLGGL